MDRLDECYAALLGHATLRDDGRLVVLNPAPTLLRLVLENEEDASLRLSHAFLGRLIARGDLVMDWVTNVACLGRMREPTPETLMRDIDEGFAPRERLHGDACEEVSPPATVVEIKPDVLPEPSPVPHAPSMFRFVNFLQTHAAGNDELVGRAVVAAAPLWENVLRYGRIFFDSRKHDTLFLALALLTGKLVEEVRVVTLVNPFKVGMDDQRIRAGLSGNPACPLVVEPLSEVLRTRLRTPLRSRLGPELCQSLKDALWSELGEPLGEAVWGCLRENRRGLKGKEQYRLWEMLCDPYRTALFYLYGFALAGEEEMTEGLVRLISFFAGGIPLGVYPDRPSTYLVAIR